jgi:hypothetical protein
MRIPWIVQGFGAGSLRKAVGGAGVALGILVGGSPAGALVLSCQDEVVAPVPQEQAWPIAALKGRLGDPPAAWVGRRPRVSERQHSGYVVLPDPLTRGLSRRSNRGGGE